MIPSIKQAAYAVIVLYFLRKIWGKASRVILPSIDQRIWKFLHSPSVQKAIKQHCDDLLETVGGMEELKRLEAAGGRVSWFLFDPEWQTKNRFELFKKNPALIPMMEAKYAK